MITENELKELRRMLKSAIQNNDWDYVYEANEFIDEFLEISDATEEDSY